MGTSAVKAGETFVKFFLDKNDLLKGLREVEGNLRSVGTAVAKVGLKFTALGAAAASAFIPAISAASDMQETMSKFNTVFGSNARAIKQWSDDYANSVGRSRKQLAEFLSESQDLFVPLGFDDKSATEMSQTITKLAIDLASFNNKADGDAFRDLTSALTGSSEVMKKYGVIVDEAAVKQQLLTDGLDPSAATNQEKVMARLAIILRGTAAAQGDAIRTGDSWANQMKRLVATIENVKDTVGAPLIQAFNGYLVKINETIPKLEIFLQNHEGLIVAMAQGAGIISGFGIALTGVGGAAILAASSIKSFRELTTVFTELGAKIGPYLTPILTTARTQLIALAAAAAPIAAPALAIAAGVAAVGGALYLLQKHTGAFDPLLEAIQNVWEKITTELKPVFDEFINKLVTELGPAFQQLASAAGSALSQIFEAAKPLIDILIEIGSVIAEGMLDSFIASVKLLANTFETLLTPAIDLAKASLSALSSSLDTILRAAEFAGLITSREENKRGADLDAQLAELKKRREAEENGGQPGTDAGEKETPKPEVDPEEKKRQQEAEKKRQEEEQQKQRELDALKSFIDSQRQANMTDTDRFNAAIEKLIQAKAAGIIGNDEFNTLADAERAKLDESLQRDEEAKQQELDAARDKEREQLEDAIRQRVELARASGDFHAEMKAMADGAQQAAAQGFNPLAADLAREQIGTLGQEAGALEDRYQQSLESADFQTGSAMEAVFGIGTSTVDEQALEEAKQMRAAIERATTFLERIDGNLEE